MTHIIDICDQFIVVRSTPNSNENCSFAAWKNRTCLRLKIMPPFSYVIDMHCTVSGSVAPQNGHKVAVVGSLFD